MGLSSIGPLLEITMPRPLDRLPPLAREQMDPAQQAAADELIAGPRKGVKGPFIPLLRSPELLARLQKVGEYLRFENSLPPRLSEFATLVVSRTWTQQFEWFVHVPLALKEGTSPETISALRAGCRPASMSPDEALVYDFTIELTQHHCVSDDTFGRCVARLGERALVDLVGTIGYFAWMSMILNVAHTPPVEVDGVEALPPLP
jgi:4-carboxymuconolactone decarboxylase